MTARESSNKASAARKKALSALQGAFWGEYWQLQRQHPLLSAERTRMLLRDAHPEEYQQFYIRYGGRPKEARPAVKLNRKRTAPLAKPLKPLKPDKAAEKDVLGLLKVLRPAAFQAAFAQSRSEGMKSGTARNRALQALRQAEPVLYEACYTEALAERQEAAR